MLRYAIWKSPAGNERVYINGLGHLAEKVYATAAPGTVGGVKIQLTAPQIDQAKAAVKEAILRDLLERGETREGAEAFSFPLLRRLADAGARPKWSGANAGPRIVPLQAADRPGLLSRSGSHDMTVESIPVEVPTTIWVDHREPRQIVELLERVANVTVVVESLSVGDYIISADGRTVVVERKTALDFQVSILDGRLFDEVTRIGLIPDEIIGVVILEGNPYGPQVTILPQSVTGAITCISALQGMVVLPTLDYIHTAYALVKLGHHLHGLGYELPLHRRKPKQLVDQRIYILQSIPGISGALAVLLLEHFGSVRACLNATREELLKVKGMGKKRADEFLSALEVGLKE